jgi:hydrogenase maturation factor HypF (carbamoyltransferase family)
LPILKKPIQKSCWKICCHKASEKNPSVAGQKTPSASSPSQGSLLDAIRDRFNQNSQLPFSGEPAIALSAFFLEKAFAQKQPIGSFSFEEAPTGCFYLCGNLAIEHYYLLLDLDHRSFILFY